MSSPLRPIQRTIIHPGRQLQRKLRLLRQPTDAGRLPEPPRDVWRWTHKRKYRYLAVGLLLVNTLLFAGLGCFTYWLRTGEFTPFTGRPYSHLLWEAFNPTGTRQITLTDFLIRPIPADQVPLMIVIVSLVLASLTAIPILISMLYRFPFSLPFTAVIGLIAVFPWLAITVTFCCYLARLRALRFSFRLATALLAYLPVVIYYALAAGDQTRTAHLAPLEVARLYLPWILAITFAFLVMAIVLLIARIVNDRPDAIAPLLALMFGIPVLLFEGKVGRDELYYRLLQAEYGPSSLAHFRDHLDLHDAVDQIAQAHDDTPLSAAAREQIALEIQLRAASGQPQLPELLTLMDEEFATQQHETVAACEAFRRRYPGSRYVPNTLYIEGQALDTRIDPRLVFFSETLYVRYYQDFPWRASLPIWTELRDRFPESAPLSSVAGLRSATLAARDGDVDRAIAVLKDVIVHGRVKPEASTQPTTWTDMLARRPASSSLDIDIDTIRLDCRKLLDLLEANRDPEHNNIVLRELLGLDPRDPHYRDNLQHLNREIRSRFPLARLRDNVEVLLARSQPSPSLRIDELRTCIQRLSHASESDALPRARFELGVTYQEDKRPEEARAVWEQLKALAPDSPWAAEAGRRLAGMGAAGRGPG